MKTCLLATIALVLSSSMRSQETYPDFSGDWVLDRQQSDFGNAPLPVPLELTEKIEHQDPRLIVKRSIRTAAATSSEEWTLSTDNTPTTTKIGAAEIPSIARWDGQSLQIEFRRASMYMRDVRTLDGKGRMISNLFFKTPQGEGERKQVFVRKTARP